MTAKVRYKKGYQEVARLGDYAGRSAAMSVVQGKAPSLEYAVELKVAAAQDAQRYLYEHPTFENPEPSREPRMLACTDDQVTFRNLYARSYIHGYINTLQGYGCSYQHLREVETQRFCSACSETFYGHGGHYCNSCYEQLSDEEQSWELERRIGEDSQLFALAAQARIEGYRQAQHDSPLLDKDALAERALRAAQDKVSDEQRMYYAHSFISGYHAGIQETSL
jgi:hypothetical protein